MTFPANGGHPAHGAAACQDANKQLELGEGRNESGLRETSEIDAAFAAIKKKGAVAVVVHGSLPTKNAAELAVKHGLPAATQTRSFAQVGGLMSYGADGPTSLGRQCSSWPKSVSRQPNASAMSTNVRCS
jgi:hypothetical protein